MLVRLNDCIFFPFVGIFRILMKSTILEKCLHLPASLVEFVFNAIAQNFPSPFLESISCSLFLCNYDENRTKKKKIVTGLRRSSSARSREFKSCKGKRRVVSEMDTTFVWRVAREERQEAAPACRKRKKKSRSFADDP